MTLTEVSQAIERGTPVEVCCYYRLLHLDTDFLWSDASWYPAVVLYQNTSGFIVRLTETGKLWHMVQPHELREKSTDYLENQP